MSAQGQQQEASDLVRGSILVFVSLAVVACAITMVFLAMRRVLDVGGFCAEGGPYEIRQHCPQGVVPLMFGGVWGGMIAAGLYAWQAHKRGVGYFVWLLWPALFIALGFNFLQYGIDPPGPGGVAAGWLVCAVLFILMGAVPLVFALPYEIRHFRGETGPRPWHHGIVPIEATGQALSALATLAAVQKGVRRSEPPPPEAPSAPDDVVSALERLDALRRSGALSEHEYEEAKRKVLEGA